MPHAAAPKAPTRALAWALCACAVCAAVAAPAARPLHAQPAAPAAPCDARGALAPGYAALEVAAEGALALSGPWELVRAHGRGDAVPKWDALGDRVETLHLRGDHTQHPVARPDPDVKTRAVWLRHTFTLPPDAPLDRLSLDLGGRYGRTHVWLNGEPLHSPKRSNAPLLFASSASEAPDAPDHRPTATLPRLPLRPGANTLLLRVEIGRFVDGLHWFGPARLGPKLALRARGRLTRTFTSALDRTPQTFAVYAPPCADLSRPVPVVLALPGWNGNIHTFDGAALLDAASAPARAAAPFLVVVPPTRGNVLYSGPSELGVLEVLDRALAELPIDPDRVLITGLSMGGAGALQLAHHYPHRFAAVASYYGETDYDRAIPWVGRSLKTDAQARQYSVLHFAANARNLPVLLVHARDDQVAPFHQSADLARAAKRLALGDDHAFIALPDGGHTLDVFDRTLPRLLDLLDRHRRVARPLRVSFRANSPRYDRAYWAGLALKRDRRFATIDLHADPDRDTLTVLACSSNVRALTAQLDAFPAFHDGLTLHIASDRPCPLRLAGLPAPADWRVVPHQHEGSAPRPRAEGGALLLDPLPPGAWRLIPNSGDGQHPPVDPH